MESRSWKVSFTTKSGETGLETTTVVVTPANGPSQAILLAAMGVVDLELVARVEVERLPS